MTGVTINSADLSRVMTTLNTLPSNVRRNAVTSALNAGARVIRDRAKKKAPGCLVRSIKNVRLKQENGDPVTAIKAGYTGSLSRPDAELRAYAKEIGASKSRGSFCTPAIWVEFGTYGHRSLSENPYAPATLRKKSYKSGRSNSPYWATPNKWVTAQPFLRPAAEESFRDGSIEKAMLAKFDEYFKRLEK